MNDEKQAMRATMMDRTVEPMSCPKMQPRFGGSPFIVRTRAHR
jgi:hypothetical protein